MASTKEYSEALRKVTDKYLKRCTPLEMMGALQWLIFEVCIACEAADEEDDE
ncbi:MAG: hypothetical protein V3T22_10615 [Planctomycetota bacterium]